MAIPNPRRSDLPIDPLFLERWSPRAFSGEDIPEEQLLILLEAARWAPSGYNAQPWRFIYVLRNSPGWEGALDLLSAYNRGWAQGAAALIFIGSHTRLLLAGAEAPTDLTSHSFDAGAAWGFLALQAVRLGIATHAVGGFDRRRAAETLNAPADFGFDAAIALGRRGDPSSLPEKLAARETPSGRHALSAIAHRDSFPDRNLVSATPIA